ncbi:MAG: peptidase U32 [Chitinivibrionales bacterium]|nr:peptidase U32 [Chitinivibrionales bacterium]
MNLSVGYTFDEKLIGQLAEIPQVHEIYGKLDRDIIGGGRSTYTLRPTTRRRLKASIKKAHAHGMEFNYLLNAATLNGLEQSRRGRKRIRGLLDYVVACDVDSVTVAAPFLIKLVKKHYPQLKVRVGVFAVVDGPVKARGWEEMGADTICVSSIAANRNFEVLESIRSAVDCTLQLIVNAACQQGCTHELTHMNLLSNSSRRRDPLRGFAFDYCFLHCSARRLLHPVHFMRSCWIRPEDLHYYEKLGYTSFKIIERSSPADLVLKRVRAYADRSFDGNLWELVAPVAQINRTQHASFGQRLRVIRYLFRPDMMKTATMLDLKRYADMLMIRDFSKKHAPVYIDNKALGGFIEGLMKRKCSLAACDTCDYCSSWADKVVHIDTDYKIRALRLARKLEGEFIG